MDIKSKDRLTLKGFFKKNSIPTESNFADLIDGMLNLKDDGIVKSSGDPLSIAAADTGLQKLINFYTNFNEANPAWMLQLNPRSDQNRSDTAKLGFSISDAQGVSRLFIDKNTGNVGIGTISSDAKLTVAGDIYVDANARLYGRGRLHIHGEELLYLLNKSGVVVGKEWGGNGSLAVQGVITTSSSKLPPAKNQYGVPDAVSGIRFADNPGGGGQDAAWIQYYARSGEACTLEIGVSNDGDDHIALMPSGNVGIGTIDPKKKLHIQGNASAPLINDSNDRPGLAITGNYPELNLFSGGANNANHGATIRMGSYNDDQNSTFKQWVIGTAGRNSTFLDIGFSDKNDPNPHAGIRDYNGKTCLTILENGNVGIGKINPEAKLDIMATTTTWNGWYEAIRFSQLPHSAITHPSGGLLFGMHSDRNFYFADTKRGQYVLTIEGATGNIKSPMWNVTQIFSSRQGGLPLTSLKFNTGGGGLMIIASGSGFGSGNIGMDIQIDGQSIGQARTFTNEAGSHKTFTCNALTKGGIAAGTHTITLVALAGTVTDGNDWFNVTVLEFPFQPSSPIIPIIIGPVIR